MDGEPAVACGIINQLCAAWKTHAREKADFGEVRGDGNHTHTEGKLLRVNRQIFTETPALLANSVFSLCVLPALKMQPLTRKN